VLSACSGYRPLRAAIAAPLFPRSFAGSPTVSSFASGLFFYEDVMPIALKGAVEAELARTDDTSDSEIEERRSSEFFAWLTVRVIAPAYLRRAGYHHLAADCEKQSDLWNGRLASATAQHTIGKQYACSSTPRLASVAYGARAHAATAAFYAGHKDMQTVIETGHYCARALLEGLSYDDTSAADTAQIWDLLCGLSTRPSNWRRAKVAGTIWL
jgi:hypothetical protein